MAVYSAPEGFIWDPTSGLYVRESILTDGAGVRYRHRMYFNADTGEYTQFSEPITEAAPPMAPAVQPAYTQPAPAGKKVKTAGKTVKTAKKAGKPGKKRSIWFFIGAAAVITIVLFLTISRNNHKFVALTDEQKEEFLNDYIVEEVPAWSVDAEPYYGEINGGGIIK